VASFCNDALKKTFGPIFVLAALTLCGRASAQTFNVYEGLNALENNWADYSWCSDDLSDTSYIYEGTSSIQVTYTAAWQGLQLVSGSSFPASYFSGLRLTLNGGKTAGRSINAYFLVNGGQSPSLDLKKFIQGGSIGKNVWRVATLPLAAFGIKPTDTVTGFVLQDSSGAAQPAYWVGHVGWVSAEPHSVVTVSVNAGTPLRAVDQKMFGVNTEMWDSGFTTSANTTLLSQSGFKAYRYPGGSESDAYNWATNTTDANTWTWAVNFDQFASVAVPNTKGQCFITVNYGTGTAAEAASWVTYSNITKQYGLKYWEVGNEVYGTWEEDSHARKNDPVIYATQFAQYYQAMKAADPTILVGAVSSPGEDAYANYSDEVVTNPRTGQQHSGWTAVMLATMAKLGVTPDYIIYHRYPEYVNDCDFTLLAGVPGFSADIADLRQQLKDYLGSANTRTDIMCTENNCDAGTPGKQMCSVVNGLFLADSFGTVLQTECKSFMWWDWINGQATNGDNAPWLYGWRMYGDEGIVSPDWTQTYPVFYMEQLVNLFAAAGDQVLPATSSSGLLSVYSTKRSDGSIRLMVVNKHPSQELAAQFNFSGFSPTGPAAMYRYGIAQDNLAKLGRPQSVSSSTITTWPTRATVSFPPYSVSVIVLAHHK